MHVVAHGFWPNGVAVAKGGGNRQRALVCACPLCGIMDVRGRGLLVGVVVIVCGVYENAVGGAMLHEILCVV